MSLAALGVLVRDALLAILGNSALTQKILDLIGIPAQESSVQEAVDNSGNALVVLTDHTYGLAALLAAINDEQAALAGDIASLAVDVANLHNGNTPVSLPVVPPSGYGAGPGVADIVAGVWNDVDGDTGEQKRALLTQAGMLAENLGNYSAFQTGGSPYLYFRGEWNAHLLGGGLDSIPLPDVNLIRADDTPLTWLLREAPDWGWVENINGSGWVGANSISGPGTWEFQVFPDQWLAIKRAILGLNSATAPIWPGIDNVILGAAVDLAGGVTVAGPMDGVIIHLTAVPAKSAFFTFDGSNSYRNIGALSFTDDNGAQEFPQGLGFLDAVYVPKSLASAGSCKIRCVGGVTGTATPWVVALTT